MVQGTTTKGGQSKPNNNARRAHKAAANTKKGRRTVAPKKATAIKQASMHKASPYSPHVFPPLRTFFFLAYLLNHAIDTECQNKQICRTTDGECRLVWETHYHETLRHGEVSTQYHVVLLVLQYIFILLFLSIFFFHLFRCVFNMIPRNG